MNERINSIAVRQTEVRSAPNEQRYAANAPRERSGETAQPCQCGLDTGTRGWRYVYQTH